MQAKFKKWEDDDYESEDESQNNESIDDISVEEGGDINAGVPEDQKSRASLQHLRSNPELLDTDGKDVQSLMSGGKGGKGI